KEPDPGARPHPAGTAVEEGSRRHDDPRLQATRDDDPVRGARRRHREGHRRMHEPPSHQEFLRFLRTIDRNTPKSLDRHLVVDNYATHKHPKVKAWLKRHPRFPLHFTPTSASWINLVERFFGLITSDAIRRGVFRSVAELKTAIEAYLKQHNIEPKPFVWTASATDILEKVARGRQVLESLH